MESKSIGWGKVSKQTFSSLKNDVSCKWLIVGGGITGLSAAHFLLEAGETDIVIIEKKTIGSGSTGHSAGMLVYEAEHEWWPYYLKKYGKSLTQKYFTAQQEALSLVRQLILKNNISCGYESENLLFLGDTKSENELIRRDFIARRQLHRDSTLLPRETLSPILKKQKYTVAELTRGEVSVNPLLFARGFAANLKRRGVKIYEHTSCISISEKLIETERATITCEKYLLCRGVSEADTRLKKFLTTISLTRPLSKLEIKGFGLHGAKMFIDSKKQSFYYGKITRDKRLLIGYGDIAFKPSKHFLGYIHQPHIRTIEAHIKKTTLHLLPFSNTWSAPYAISTLDVPLVVLDKNHALINGGGTQSTSIVAAEYAVAKLLKKKHPLEKLLAQ
jgi:glycine/D-amino acid oxidase-like deaminating enzyme